MVGYKGRLLPKKREEVIQMASQKTISVVLLVVGIVILLLSVFANPIGIGNPARFGYIQIAGTIVGVIVTLVGLFLALKR
jgi:hypothetical protein